MSISKFLIMLWVASLSTIASADVPSEISEQVEKIHDRVSLLGEDINRVKTSYDDPDVMPRDRDRRYFREDLEDVKTDNLYASDGLVGLVNELESVIEEYLTTNTGEPTVVCGVCAWPGRCSCNIIDSNGQITNTIEQACTLDLTRYSCGRCRATGSFAWDYDVFYDGVRVTMADGGPASSICNDNRAADSRCN